MHVSESTYNRISKGVGVLVTFMGLSQLAMYVVFVATGSNPLVASLPGIDAVGQMAFASIGAFALPVGVFLLRKGPDTQGRLRIAAFALGLMAVVRIIGFTNVETRALVGTAPLVEFFVLGAIAVAALVIRPSRAGSAAA